jgi:hypothetical protein
MVYLKIENVIMRKSLKDLYKTIMSEQQHLLNSSSLNRKPTISNAKIFGLNILTLSITIPTLIIGFIISGINFKEYFAPNDSGIVNLIILINVFLITTDLIAQLTLVNLSVEQFFEFGYGFIFGLQFIFKIGFIIIALFSGCLPSGEKLDTSNYSGWLIFVYILNIIQMIFTLWILQIPLLVMSCVEQNIYCCKLCMNYCRKSSVQTEEV